ncbi:hypothetical protein B0H13DRAFT_1888212 [Mycena leptocephala]|nr:hypothetical protein B0H13DRAFT_1888212 [Mycena leptocephala]
MTSRRVATWIRPIRFENSGRHGVDQWISVASTVHQHHWHRHRRMNVCSLSRETYHTLRAMGHPPRLLRVLLSSSEVAEGQGQGPDPNDTNQENSTEGTRPDANAKAPNRRPKRADKDGSFLEYFSPHPDHVPPALPVDRLLVRRTARKGAGALEYTMLDFHKTKHSAHRHKFCFASPTLGAQSAVHPNHLVQDAGGFVITLKLGARPVSALTSEEETFPCCLRRPARSTSRVARRRKWDSGGWIHFPSHPNETHDGKWRTSTACWCFRSA